MQIAGVIILYYPDVETTIRNINSYIDHLDLILIFDNTPQAQENTSERLHTISPKITFIQNNKNEGIAKPLNHALEAVSNGYKWLLTMDQDSYFEPGQATLFFSSFHRRFILSEEVAIVCPNHALPKESSSPEECKEVRRAITSGSIVNTEICKRLNGFNERLFIDQVDFEYCYRCVIAGYKICQFHNIYLNHTIGTVKETGYLNVVHKSNRSLHNPVRIYYMVRNFLFVSSKYKKLLPDEIANNKKELGVILKNNLFFSGQFFKVLASVVKGYVHFKLNKFSS